MNKKYIVTAGVIATALTGMLLFISVNAEDLPAQTGMDRKQPMMVEIGPAGKALVRGTVESVGTSSITVKSWGGNWVANVSSSTKLAPKTDISQFKVGDFVGVQGTASISAAWTIDATLIRNRTERKEIRTEIKENKDKIKATIKAVTTRNWEGTASEVNNDVMTFKLKVGEATYEVKLAANAKVVNKAFATLSFGSIKNGDTVRVYGPAADMVITASVVRDVSLGTEAR